MRLEEGVAAPELAGTDLEGNAVTLADYRGQRLWLILSRFAACPFCSLRLEQVVSSYPQLQQAGVDVLVVFPSPIKRVQKWSDKYNPPFVVLPDPEQTIFAQFGSETSWAGELKTAINIPKVLRALMKARMSPLALDNPIHMMPSDYLIEGDGTISRAHYGEELDDGLEIAAVIEWGKGE